MNVVNILLILFAAKIGISSIKKYIIRPQKLKMKLIEYSNTDMVKVIDLPDELYEGSDLDVKDNEVYQKIYEEFGKVIEEKIPREDLDNYFQRKGGESLKAHLDDEIDAYQKKAEEKELAKENISLPVQQKEEKKPEEPKAEMKVETEEKPKEPEVKEEVEEKKDDKKKKKRGKK